MRYKDFDRPLFIVMLVILGLGLLSLYSASFQINPDLLIRQVVWMAIGIIFFFIAIIIDYHKFLELSYLLYLLSIALLIAVLMSGEVRLGAQRWLMLGPINFQPSEIYKIAVIMALSRFLGGLTTIRRLHFVFACMICFIPSLLILKQPDLGSALILFPLFISMLWASGIGAKSLAYLICLGIGICPIMWQFLRDYQKDRLLVFINPNHDPLGAGYTIIQSKIAIGSGRLFGKGWLGGTQNQLNFLPERHTDFIFSVVGEEWGMLGAFALICMFLFLVQRGLKIASQTNEPYGRLLAGGLSFLLGFQVFVNIGMTMGLLPVVGLPLPLISYGGSSMVVTMFMLGLLENVNIRRARF